MTYNGRARRRAWTLATLDREVDWRLFWDDSEHRWQVLPLVPARLVTLWSSPSYPVGDYLGPSSP